MDAAMQSGYASRDTKPFAMLIADRWWTLVVRGLVAIAFGVFALAAPRTSVLALVYVFGAYAVIDGVVHLMSAGRTPIGRGWLIFQGLVSIAAGVVAFAWTALTAVLLVMVIAAWAVLTGIAELVAAFRMRREIEGEWLLATAGVLSIIFGGVLFAAPEAGAVALLWIIGAYAIVFGLILIGLGARMRSWQRDTKGKPPTETTAPAGAVAT
jgi:uncharacterized membrane protein HdeD (DUF308 family)